MGFGFQQNINVRSAWPLEIISTSRCGFFGFRNWTGEIRCHQLISMETPCRGFRVDMCGWLSHRATSGHQWPPMATNGHQVHVCIGGKRVSDDIHTFEAGVQIVFLGAGDVTKTPPWCNTTYDLNRFFWCQFLPNSVFKAVFSCFFSNFPNDSEDSSGLPDCQVRHSGSSLPHDPTATLQHSTRAGPDMGLRWRRWTAWEGMGG